MLKKQPYLVTFHETPGDFVANMVACDTIAREFRTNTFEKGMNHFIGPIGCGAVEYTD